MTPPSAARLYVSFPLLLFSDVAMAFAAPSSRMSSVSIGPLRIARLSQGEARARIESAREGSTPLCVAFCNAHTAKLAFDDPAYAKALDGMLLLNDGLGIDLAARALGHGAFPANLNGTDFVPALLRENSRPLRIFLLGAKPQILTRAASVIATRFPQHAIVGRHDGYFADSDLAGIGTTIASSHADIVLCAMGNPRQEKVIAALAETNVAPVLIGVGALFDFLADAVPRAPHWVRRMRMEFVYRLLQEPKRLGRRYTVEIVEFLVAIARLRFTRPA